MSTAVDSERDPPLYPHHAAPQRELNTAALSPAQGRMLARPKIKWPKRKLLDDATNVKTTEFVTLVLFEKGLCRQHANLNSLPGFLVQLEDFRNYAEVLLRLHRIIGVEVR